MQSKQRFISYRAHKLFRQPSFLNGCDSHFVLVNSSQKLTDHQKYLENNHTKFECNPTDGSQVIVPTSFLGGHPTKMFLPHPRVKLSIVGSLRDRELACSASDRQGSNFESCVWRTVSSHLSHHHQEVRQAQFSLYVHKSGLKPDSFHFISFLLFTILTV